MIYSRKVFISILLCILFIVIVAHLIIYSTIWRYDLNGRNMDDKTSYLMVSEMSLIDYTNHKWLINNLDNIIKNCNNDNCKARIKERASLSYNYIIPSRLIKYFTSLGRIIYNNEINAISFGIFWGYLSLHFLSYLFLACLIVRNELNKVWWILLGLIVLLLTDELIFNIHLDYFSYIFPEKVKGDGYHPTIYVARGPLAIFFFGLCSAYLLDNKRWMYLLIIILPLIHLGQAIILLTIFFTILIIEKLINMHKNEFSSNNVLLFVLIFIINLYLIFNYLYVSVRPTININTIANSISTGFNYKTVVILIFVILSIYICSYSNISSIFKKRISIMCTTFLVLLELLKIATPVDTNIPTAASQINDRINGNIYFIAQSLVLVCIYVCFVFAAKVLKKYSKIQLFIKSQYLIGFSTIALLSLTGNQKALLNNINDAVNTMSNKYLNTIPYLMMVNNKYRNDLLDHIKFQYPEDFSNTDLMKWININISDNTIKIDKDKLISLDVNTINPHDEVRYHLNLYYYFRNNNQ
jgi:hypothetical protein